MYGFWKAVFIAIELFIWGFSLISLVTGVGNTEDILWVVCIPLFWILSYYKQRK